MSIKVEVSVGEFLDKLTILRIKAERISDPDKLENIRRELVTLNALWSASSYAGDAALAPLIRDLQGVNETLWDIEDSIRDKEAAGEFDPVFIELARAVYINNDKRAAIKRAINVKTGSAVVEEKSYSAYPHAD
jgi:hypothetical protein